jgi:HK97 family phage portal protein
MFGAETSESGEVAGVSHERALNQITYATCIELLARDIAKLPIHLYRAAPGGVRERAEDDPRYWMLKQAPNPDMTRVEFVLSLMGNCLSWGNGYAVIERDGIGRPKAIYPLLAQYVKPYRSGRNLRYEVRYPEIAPTSFAAADVIHIKRYTLDGITGVSPIGMLRLTIGQQVRADEYAAKFYTDGALLSGVIAADGELSDEGRSALEASWKKFKAGVRNAFSILVLEAGSKFQPMAIPQKDAQFLESNRFRAEQVSAFLGIPLYRLNDLTKMTYTKLEENALSYKQDTLLFWTEMITGELDRKLIGQNQNLYFEFNFDQYLQADRVATEDANTKALQRGVTINEMRRRDNLPPVEGGDTPLVPVNMQTLDRAINPPEPAAARPAPVAGEASRRHSVSCSCGSCQPKASRTDTRAGRYLRVAITGTDALEDAIARVVRKEVSDVHRLLPKLQVLDDWENLLDSYYSDEIRNRVARDLEKVFLSITRGVHAELAEQLSVEIAQTVSREFAEAYAANYAKAYTSESALQLAKLAKGVWNPEDLIEVVRKRLREWEEKRARKEADAESVRIANKAARETYRQHGIQTLVWRANANACPLCQSMDGRTCGIESPFLAHDDKVDPGDGKTAPLTVRGNLMTPPLHGGCFCWIEPGG